MIKHHTTTLSVIHGNKLGKACPRIGQVQLEFCSPEESNVGVWYHYTGVTVLRELWQLGSVCVLVP